MLEVVDDDALGAEIDARFDASVAAALARAPRRPPDGFRFGLPEAVRAGIIGAAARTGGLPDVLGEYYLERMPRMLVEQMFVADDPAARLLWQPLRRAPRLAGALAGVDRVVGSAIAHLAAEPPAALHARALFGGSAPLLGAYPVQRELMNAELAAGADPDAVLDLRLSGNLVHELCHGRPAPMPWTILEAVAVTLGARARPEHIFPEVAGEAVPGVSLFVCLGDVLARRFGASLWKLLDGATAQAVFGAGPARVFEAAAWQDWLARRTAPFVIDPLDAFAWAKLVELACAGADPERPDLLGVAERTAWSDLPWYDEAPTGEDAAMLATGVRALFQANVLTPTFQTHPAELPGGELVVDLEAGLLVAAARPEGVFAEPARWLAPPPFCRVLRERGARRLRVVGATRTRHGTIAGALLELAGGTGPLPSETVVALPPPARRE